VTLKQKANRNKGGKGMSDLVKLSVEEMTGLDYNCSCGRTHKVEIDNIKVGNGVIDKLPDVINDYIGKRVFIIEDTHTFEVAGKKVEELLKDEFKISRHVFNNKHLIPNETALGRLIMEIPKDTELVVAVGSGTINDISRFLSYKIGVPYVIVGTAPSMDGYASVVSPLVCDNVKVTFDAIYPMAIIGDIDIMKNAPMQMLQAGLGDILGKYTALADWHIAKILNNEYFCSEVESLVMSSLKEVEKAASGLTSRKDETIKNITNALILSGIAIGMVGASRPASGGEHQLSHCYEMIFMNRGGDEKWLHGNTVGVGVGAVAYAFEYAKKLDINEIIEKEEYLKLDKDKWLQNIKDVYTKSAENIIQFKQDSINFEVHQRKAQMDKIAKKWDAIKNICTENVPEPEDIIGTLKKCGAVWNPKDIDIDREMFIKSFIAAKDMRKRYGIFQLLEDMGKLDDAANYIADIYYN
jgi:glycerol-1-phosphate dehydrogenase [NAD(P)+]